MQQILDRVNCYIFKNNDTIICNELLRLILIQGLWDFDFDIIGLIWTISYSLDQEWTEIFINDHGSLFLSQKISWNSFE